MATWNTGWTHVSDVSWEGRRVGATAGRRTRGLSVGDMICLSDQRTEKTKAHQSEAYISHVAKCKRWRGQLRRNEMMSRLATSRRSTRNGAADLALRLPRKGL